MEDPTMKSMLFILMLFLCCWACKEDDLSTYHGADGIYFASKGTVSSTDYTDSTEFSFAFAPVPDTIIRIVVRGYGEVASYDRKFNVKVEPGNAIEGVNYELLTDECVLRADSVYGCVPVRIYREVAKDTTFYIHLRLEGNEYFAQNLPFKMQGRDSVDITHHKLKFTNILKKPDLWNGLGYWSEAKFYLICQELVIAPRDWYDDSKKAEISQKAMGGGSYMVNYLNMFVEKNDYVNMPKDPLGPRGYMTFSSFSGATVNIPGTWPDASEIN